MSFILQRRKRGLRKQRCCDNNIHGSFSILKFEGKFCMKKSLEEQMILMADFALEAVDMEVYMEDQKEFSNKVRALTEIRHCNIVKLYGYCSHAQHSFLIYEYLEMGSLATVLSTEAEAKELCWRKKVNVIKGAAHALCYMHHKTLEPPNFSGKARPIGLNL